MTRHHTSDKCNYGEPDTSSGSRGQNFDMDSKEEPDFIETNCHWRGCDKEYDTQDQLVRVS